MVEANRAEKPGLAASASILRSRHPQRRVEHYWLCDDCASKWTLIYDRDRGVTLAALRRPGGTGVSAAGVNPLGMELPGVAARARRSRRERKEPTP
jgi:hypothetical protein